MSASLRLLSKVFLAASVPALTLCLRAQQNTPPAAPASDRQAAGGGAEPDRRSANEQAGGSIAGIVVDPSGALVAGARVHLTRADGSPEREAATGGDGRFLLTDVGPGAFQLSVAAAGFAPQTISGTLNPAEAYAAPQIVLAVAPANSEVEVKLSPTEIAQEQIEAQEKQRLLGAIPNFYVSYLPNAAPLNATQKSELGLRFTIDPVSFLVVGAIAGIQQANNDYAGYGQGAEGYAKRYGAAYATFFDGVLIGNVLLPALLKQDPRYFYRGTGTVKSRALYAIFNSVARKGDNGHWQPNYSTIIGDLAAGGIANAYYPERDRNGAGLTFRNAGINIAGDAAGNLAQEFLFRKLTSHSKPEPARPCAVSFSVVQVVSAGRSIPVEIYRPADTASHPLVLMLHGSAGVYTNSAETMPAEDNFGEKAIAERCFVVALPHYFEAVGQKSVTDAAALAADFPLLLATVSDVLDRMRDDPMVERSAVALYGESYGGFLAIALAAKCGCVQAVSEFSGGLPVGFAFAGKPPPFLIQHGEADSLVPVAEAYNLRDALRKAGGSVAVFTYPEAGHYYSPAVRKEILARSIDFFAQRLGRPLTSTTTSSPR